MKNTIEKKAAAPKTRQRFFIDVEGIVPVRVRFQTFAEDEQEALKQLDNPHLISLIEKPSPDLSRLIRRKITIKDANTSLVKLVKNL